MMIIEIPRKLANLHGQVSELLAARILSGAYPPETALPTEAELCQAYGVSRTTLREAIKNLVAKGFLEVAPSRGTWVRPMRAWNLLDEEVLRWRVALGINAKLVQDIYEMRECFEPRATAFTAERGTAADHSAIA
ncbi:MAG: GntR family transcriptional regulator, partial [Oricola sp.]